MFQQFLKDIRLHKSGFFSVFGIMAGSFLFGMVMVFIIMNVDDDPGSWFCMGTLIAALVLVAIGLFLAAFSYAQEFMLALSMGRTRKTFMVSYYLRHTLQLVGGWVLLLGLHQVELQLYPLLFPQYQNAPPAARPASPPPDPLTFPFLGLPLRNRVTRLIALPPPDPE